ncbi:hypothetical protein V5799_027704 [Amblyomma americanum]|uniref:Uncharacterized protein n=1 Tax=Amblyomma americanum TaxID=6943 RepID=A0AAQ4DEZ0_AMBAM
MCLLPGQNMGCWLVREGNRTVVADRSPVNDPRRRWQPGYIAARQFYRWCLVLRGSSGLVCADASSPNARAFVVRVPAVTNSVDDAQNAKHTAGQSGQKLGCWLAREGNRTVVADRSPVNAGKAESAQH